MDKIENLYDEIHLDTSPFERIVELVEEFVEGVQDLWKEPIERFREYFDEFEVQLGVDIDKLLSPRGILGFFIPVWPDSVSVTHHALLES